MQFKVKNVSVKISFSFLALILLFLVYGKVNVYLITLLFATVHEATHILFIYLFSGNISSITLSVFGGNIKRQALTSTSYLKEALISISAPMLNLMLAFVFYSFNAGIPLLYQVNFILGFINIIPFYAFDGGRFLQYVLLTKFCEEKTDKILTAISVITTIIICVISVTVLTAGTNNYSLPIFCLYMILSLILKK